MKKNILVGVLVVLLLVAAGCGVFYAKKYSDLKKDNDTKEETKQDDSSKQNGENKNEDIPDELKVVKGEEVSLVYNLTNFVISGRNSNCEINYDKEFSVSKNVTEGKIVKAKVMIGFFGDATEAGVIILDNGDVYSVILGCDNDIEYEKVDILKDYKVSDVIELNLSPGCVANMECKKTATVILQDGTKKEIIEDISFSE